MKQGDDQLKQGDGQMKQIHKTENVSSVKSQTKQKLSAICASVVNILPLLQPIVTSTEKRIVPEMTLRGSAVNKKSHDFNHYREKKHGANKRHAALTHCTDPKHNVSSCLVWIMSLMSEIIVNNVCPTCVTAVEIMGLFLLILMQYSLTGQSNYSNKGDQSV